MQIFRVHYRNAYGDRAQKIVSAKNPETAAQMVRDMLKPMTIYILKIKVDRSN